MTGHDDDAGAGRVSMEAGPALDAEISRVVFGIAWKLHPYCVINGVRKDVPTWMYDEDWCSPDDPPGGWTWGVKPPPYSTDITAAWTVVEHLKSLGGAVLVEYQQTKNWPEEMTELDPAERWRCGYGISGTDMCWRFASGDTMPLAVCRAALLAAGTPDDGQGGA